MNIFLKFAQLKKKIYVAAPLKTNDLRMLLTANKNISFYLASN